MKTEIADKAFKVKSTVSVILAYLHSVAYKNFK